MNIKLEFPDRKKLLTDEEETIFRGLCSYKSVIVNNTAIYFTEAYSEDSLNEDHNKEALRTFAREWQFAQSSINSSYEELAYWGSFFSKYGKEYGLIDEFTANGII